MLPDRRAERRRRLAEPDLEFRQRTLELLVSNRLRSDLDTAASYTRFISVLQQVDEQLPSDRRRRRRAGQIRARWPGRDGPRRGGRWSA